MQNQELFKDDIYRVVHSPEEKQAYLGMGWSEQRALGVEYRVHTASKPAAFTRESMQAAADMIFDAVQTSKQLESELQPSIEQSQENYDGEPVAGIAIKRGPGRPKRVVEAD